MEERCWEMGSSIAARDRRRNERRESVWRQSEGVRAGCWGWEGGAMVGSRGCVGRVQGDNDCGFDANGRTGSSQWEECS